MPWTGCSSARIRTGSLLRGSVRYNGANGLELGDITQLRYTVKHSSLNDSPIGSPYLRIFRNDGTADHDVVFDATSCATVVPTEDEFHTYEVTTATDAQIRYDDDPCSGPNPGDFAAVQAAHAGETITGIYVTTGFAGGAPLAAILRTLKVNGEEFKFGV